jgi:hypothetical protein
VILKRAPLFEEDRENGFDRVLEEITALATEIIEKEV